MAFNLFDIVIDNRSLGIERPRAACNDEVSAYVDWLRDRLELPAMGEPDLQWYQPRDWRKGECYCIGATYGADLSISGRREYADGSYSVLMPGANRMRQRVTMETLDDSGAIIAISTLPPEPKKGGIIWTRDQVRAAAGPVTKPARLKRAKAGLADHETTATPVADRGNTFGDRQANDDILPGNAPCSASEQIPRYDKGEAPTASEAPPEPEIDTIAEPVAGMWRARLVTPNFTFEAFGIDIASARRALEQGLTRHARQYGLDPGRWRAVADSIEVSFVRAGAAYCDGELIRERGYDD